MQILEIITSIITIIVGIGVIIGFFIAWRKRSFVVIEKMAKTFNLFMAEILPSLLGGFEEREIIEKGTLASWTTKISSDMYSIQSLKKLSEIGEQLLEKSGMKKIIDDDKESLLAKLEKQKFRNISDV